MTSSFWVWAGFYLFSSIAVGACWPERYGNGLTARWMRRWLTDSWMRYFTRYYLWLGAWCLIEATTHFVDWTFWAVAVGFVFDDYLFGDEPRNKRRREWVRNKVKWRMKLPQPVTSA